MVDAVYFLQVVALALTRNENGPGASFSCPCSSWFCDRLRRKNGRVAWLHLAGPEIASEERVRAVGQFLGAVAVHPFAGARPLARLEPEFRHYDVFMSAAP